MMRLAKRRMMKETRIIYSVTSPSVAVSFILYPPSLYTSLPISYSHTPSLTSTTSFFCFTIFPTHPLFNHFTDSHVHPNSSTLLSHLSLVSSCLASLLIVLLMLYLASVLPFLLPSVHFPLHNIILHGHFGI